MKYCLDSRKVAEATEQWLVNRGVTKEEIADLVLFLQQEYIPDLTKETCLQVIDRVLAKREVQNAVLVGIQLDVLAEQNKLFPTLNDEEIFWWRRWM